MYWETFRRVGMEEQKHVFHSEHTTTMCNVHVILIPLGTCALCRIWRVAIFCFIAAYNKTAEMRRKIPHTLDKREEYALRGLASIPRSRALWSIELAASAGKLGKPLSLPSPPLVGTSAPPTYKIRKISNWWKPLSISWKPVSFVKIKKRICVSKSKISLLKLLIRLDVGTAIWVAPPSLGETLDKIPKGHQQYSFLRINHGYRDNYSL